MQTDEGPVQDVEESSQLEPESAACGSSPADAEMSQGEEEDDEDIDWTHASMEESTESDDQDEFSNQEVR